MNDAPDTDPKYDVAISFLVQDIALAQAVHDSLSDGLEVFFFPRKQEELAGTDGIESMRAPFVHQSRLNVVLYRERWGNTPWTAVEAAAIRDGCLHSAFRNLFFFAVESNDKLPPWLPDTHVRFNYSDYTIEQAVGAIKLRVQERGGHYSPPTPLKRAALLQAEDQYRWDKSDMSSQHGLARIMQEVVKLFADIGTHCNDVTSLGHLQIRHDAAIAERSARQSCVLTNDRVGMVVEWHQPYSNALQKASLVVREFNGGLILNGETNQRLYLERPHVVHETKYLPDLSRSREYGWVNEGRAAEFFSSSALAEKCVMQFIDLVERDNSGKIHRNSRYD